MRLDPAVIITEIRALVARHPDLLDDEQLAIDTLEGETDALQLIDKLLFSIATAKTHCAALASHIEELSNRQIRYKAQQDTLRGLLLRLLSEAGIRKLERPTATLTVSVGPEKVVITDEDALPDWAWRIRREPAKTLIKDELQHSEVPGAQLSNREPTLIIRTA